MQFKVPAQTSAIITNGEHEIVLGYQPAGMAAAYPASKVAMYRLHFHSTSLLHEITRYTQPRQQGPWSSVFADAIQLMYIRICRWSRHQPLTDSWQCVPEARL